MQAAQQREEPLDHLLLCGPPGLGKTSMARLIADELGVNIHITSGSAIERKGDLAGMLTNLQERDILFIDEIHRLNAVVEENLYPALEDFEFDYIVGEGPHARNLKLPLKPFTLVGATTRSGLLTSPLRDRFGIINRLEFYSPDELTRIVKRSASLLEIEVTPEGALEIGRRARGTPRIANRLLRRVRDFAQVQNEGVIDKEIADHSLERLGIDQLGLDNLDRRVLLNILEKYGGGPVGVESLAAAVGEESHTIEEVCEPYLIREGLLQRTPRGRIVACSIPDPVFPVFRRAHAAAAVLPAHHRGDEPRLAVGAHRDDHGLAPPLQNLRPAEQHRRPRRRLSNVVALPREVRLVHRHLDAVARGRDDAIRGGDVSRVEHEQIAD